MTMPISVYRLLIAVLLFIAGSWMFSRIDSCHYITRTKEVPHIIDSHLAWNGAKDWQEWSTRFFDSAYVRKAAKAYNPSRYMRCYYILDFCYPFIYGFLFLTLVSGFRQSRFYRIMRVIIMACCIFDLSENTSFAWFLFHQQGTANGVVAFCTTIKSILFFLCIVVAALSFLVWTIKRIKLPGKRAEKRMHNM